MRDCGSISYKTVKDHKVGQMAVHLMANSKKGRKMEKESINGMMAAIIQENGLIIRLMDMVSIIGETEKYMKVNGSKGKCMEKANIFGRMEGDIRETIRMIESMAKVYTIGQTGEYLREHG